MVSGSGGLSPEPPGRLGGPCAVEWTAPLSRALAVVAVEGAPAWCRAVRMHRSHRAGWVGPALLSGQPPCPARLQWWQWKGPLHGAGLCIEGCSREPPGRLGGPCAAEWTAPLSRALAVVAVEGAPAWWRAVGGLSPEPPGRLGGLCAAGVDSPSVPRACSGGSGGGPCMVAGSGGSHRSHRAGWVGPVLLSGQPLCPARLQWWQWTGPLHGVGQWGDCHRSHRAGWVGPALLSGQPLCPMQLQWWQWKGPLHGAGLCIEGCSREPPGRLGGPCAAEWTAPLSRALAVVAVEGAPAWWRAVGDCHRSHRAGWVGPALLSGQPLCPARLQWWQWRGPLHGVGQ